jgi:hypothetical protein
MRSRKFAASVVAIALAASVIVPAAAAPVVVSNAAPAFRPNWGVVSIFAVTGSVILDAIYIAATQCREMTAQEAGAAMLPVVGPIYNAQQPSATKCKK